MQDSQWRLIYPGTDFTFGSGEDEVFNLTSPDLGTVDIRTADADRPRTDGVNYGVDYTGARTIAFDLGIRGRDEADVRDSSASLSRAWKADTVRLVPGAVAELQCRYRGLERAVFGRPRRFAPNLKEAKTGLFASAVAEFDCQDDRFYSVTESSATVNFVPAPGGGLMAPLAAPLATTESSDRSVGMTVASELPVWPVIEIEGPIVNPVVDLVGLWRMGFNLNLADGDTLVIDTRPWKRSILRNGASVAGTISRTSTRLGKAEIPSGTYELALRGTSTAGTARAHIRWRDSFSTP